MEARPRCIIKIKSHAAVEYLGWSSTVSSIRSSAGGKDNHNLLAMASKYYNSSGGGSPGSTSAATPNPSKKFPVHRDALRSITNNFFGTLPMMLSAYPRLTLGSDKHALEHRSGRASCRSLCGRPPLSRNRLNLPSLLSLLSLMPLSRWFGA